MTLTEPEPASQLLRRGAESPRCEETPLLVRPPARGLRQALRAEETLQTPRASPRVTRRPLSQDERGTLADAAGRRHLSADVHKPLCDTEVATVVGNSWGGARGAISGEDTCSEEACSSARR